jgi:hypothetical protein
MRDTHLSRLLASSPPPDSQDEPTPIRNRYKAANIMNFDETPLPFE